MTRVEKKVYILLSKDTMLIQALNSQKYLMFVN